MKIALIAMSGVRAFKHELTELGMSLPGFAERERTISSLPSLALLTLAGMTPDRFDVSYYEIADLRLAGELPDCDLAAVATMTAQAKDAYEVARRYRLKGTKTVIGGLHATAVPRDALRHFDAVVVGEGELSWLKVLRDLETGRLAGIYSPNGRDFDLAEAPMPRFDLLDPEKYNRLTVQTQRGCPWRCEFCASSIMLTPKYKLKPIPKVVDEIRAIRQLWARPFIEFADDNSFVNKQHSKKMMEAIGSEGVRWFTETDISVADDLELLRLMHDAGCVQVLVGFESPTAGALEGIELRRNWKRGRVNGYRDAVERIQSQGIVVTACFVLGLDGHTTSVFEDVWRFANESGVREVQITVMTPMPGSQLYSRMSAEGRLIEPTAWEKCTLFDVNVRPLQMSVEELETGFVDLARRLYSEDAKRARNMAFRRQRRSAAPELAMAGS
jgi:radical SAM superfamily enzyme YgiQ (UPF0313 family)